MGNDETYEHGTEHSHSEHVHGNDINKMAVSATLHCLTGCAIGEVLGLVLGTALALSNPMTIFISIVLAFVFGFTLSMIPLLRVGLGLVAALSIVVVADSLSIATMEVVDNTVMTAIPGAMNATLVNPVFWLAMPLSLAVAFIAAFPVNKYLLKRNKGHALTMQYHHGAHGHQH